MAFPKLFERAKIGGLEVRNRLIMAPMDKNYASATGAMTQRYVDYLADRARGGVGLILTEATYVDPLGRNRVAQLGLHDDGVIPSYRAAVDAVHSHGCRLGAQLHFAGRQASSWATGRQPVAPSPVPCTAVSSGDIPRELTLQEIRELVDKFGAAARRAREAGFDLVEIHGAHGYLLNQFLSGYANRRIDEYGGSFEKRMRFPLEVVRAVRSAVGHDYPLAFRLSASECIEGGLMPGDMAVFAQRLEGEGIDLIDVSAGTYESREWMVQPSSLPPGCLVDLARPIREAVRVPISVAGRINEPGLAEDILKQGKADFITVGRALHADPEFPSKAKGGDVAAINRCPACLVCADHLGADLPIPCMVNPAAGRERDFEIRPAERPRRVVVVGGGPAGLSAARVLGLRKHHVTLMEKESRLGGAVNLASLAPHKGEFANITAYFSEQLRRLNVDVRLGQAATSDSVAAKRPDVVVVATGTRPVIPSTPGIVGNPRVVSVGDVLEGRVPVGKRVVIMGAGRAGCETGLFMAGLGAQVTIVEPTDTAPLGVGARSGWVLREGLKSNPGISVRTRTTVEEIAAASIRLFQQGEQEWIDDLDSIVLAVGVMADTSLADELRRVQPDLEVHLVGDCVLPRGVLEAIQEGAVAGLRI